MAKLTFSNSGPLSAEPLVAGPREGSRAESAQIHALADLRRLDERNVVAMGVVDSIRRLSQPDASRRVVRECIHVITQALLRTLPHQLSSSPVVLVPVLRAGMAMWPAAAAYFPDNVTALVASSKVKGSAVVTTEWLKSTPMAGADIVVLDPIIASGDTVVRVCIEALRRYEQPRSITVAACYASPEGVAVVQAKCSAARLAVGCMSESVGADGYVIPRINGDMGDKLFGA
jgi:uracil phosphoribosyltransferase